MTTYPPLDSLVRIASERGVGTIELARPKVHNCITPSMLRTIGEAIHRFEEDCTVRAVVVAAAGRNFCTGADLAEIGPICADEGRMRDFLRTAHDTMDTIERSPLPVIAAVQGFCLAGGLELALACDVLIASEDAVFGDQHVVYGLLPSWGGTQRLPRAVGRQRALDLMFSGRRIDAATALQWGLASQAVPREGLRATALAYAEALATRSAVGLQHMKRLARMDDFGAGLEAEREEALRLVQGSDTREGIEAFKARRQPVFARRAPVEARS